MDWNALIGGLIGAGIPGTLAYVGLRRGRQASDAEAFGPAVLLLYRVDPERVTINVNPSSAVEDEKWADLRKQLDVARERLLVVSAGHPRRHVRELARAAEVKVTNSLEASRWAVVDLAANRDIRDGMANAKKRHAEAEAAMRDLIDANFRWSTLGRRPLTRMARAADNVRRRVLRSRFDVPDSRKPLDKTGG